MKMAKTTVNGLSRTYAAYDIQNQNVKKVELFNVYCLKVKVKVKVKLRFSAPSAGIAEIEQTQSSPRPLVMTLKWWGPTGTRTHSA